MKKSIIFLLTAIMIICAIGMVACSHKHVFDQEVATENYLSATATCTSKATYFKSCSCGEKGTETFESGNLLEHNYNNEVASDEFKVSDANCSALTTYYKSCDCGATSEAETFTVGDFGDHFFDPENEYKCAYCDEQDLFAYNRALSPTTVFFFNKELGKEQLASVAGGNIKESGITFDSAKSMTKLDLNLLSDEIKQLAVVTSYDLKGYLFTGGDYLVFDIYLEVNETPEETADSAKFVNFRFTGGVQSYGTTVHNGGWAQVLVPASALAGNFYIYPNVKMNATLYLGEAKAIAESEVIDIATTGNETTYTFAGLNCLGGAYATTENGTDFTYSSINGVATGAAGWSTNSAIFNQASDVVPYYVNGAIRFYVRSDKYTAPRIVIKLAEVVSFSSGTISVTARGVDLEGCNVYFRNSSDASHTGQKVFGAGVDAGNGYKTFTINTTFNASWANGSFDYLIIQVKPTVAGLYSQGMISNIVLP